MNYYYLFGFNYLLFLFLLLFFMCMYVGIKNTVNLYIAFIHYYKINKKNSKP